MAKSGLVAEAWLEEMMRAQVAATKRAYAEWDDPHRLSQRLGLSVHETSIGLGREGAAWAQAIYLDPAAGVPARRQFTFYHEICHHLLRRDDELFSILHDQYETDTLLQTISERLCNVGAAEFLLPQATVRAATLEHGFSIALIEALSQPGRVSRVAACAQLTFCAPHHCIAVVCHAGGLTATASRLPLADAAPPLLPMTHPFGQANVRAQRERVQIVCAFRSPQTKYACAAGTMLPPDHLLTSMIHKPHGEPVKAMAPIPFRRQTQWEVACEAVRLGAQVFAFFHLDDPSPPTPGQMRLW